MKRTRRQHITVKCVKIFLNAKNVVLLCIMRVYKTKLTMQQLLHATKPIRLKTTSCAPSRNSQVHKYCFWARFRVDDGMVKW